MKKTILFFLCAVLFLSCFSCGEKEPPTEEKAPYSEGLFELQGFETKKNAARLFAAEDGFVFAAETEEGINFGFVDPNRHLLQELLLQVPGAEAENIAVFGIGEKKALIAAGEKVFVLDLATGTHLEYTSEKFSPAGAILYQKMALIAPNGGRLLLAPFDLSEIFVAGSLSGLPGFGRLLSMNETGDEILYTCESEGGFEGVYATPYGRTEPKKLFEIEFDSVEALADGAFLFTAQSESETVYTYYNAAAGLEKTISVHALDAYDRVTASANGAVFLGVRKGEIEILAFDGKSGASLGKFAPEGLSGRRLEETALSPDGDTLLFSALDPETKNETVGVLHLDLYLK